MEGEVTGHSWMEALVTTRTRALSTGLALGSALGALTVLLIPEVLRVF